MSGGQGSATRCQEKRSSEDTSSGVGAPLSMSDSVRLPDDSVTRTVVPSGEMATCTPAGSIAARRPRRRRPVERLDLQPTSDAHDECPSGVIGLADPPHALAMRSFPVSRSSTRPQALTPPASF